MASRAVVAADLPVPGIIDGMIEFEGREGIVFERVDGPTLRDHILANAADALPCAKAMADLHVRIHGVDASGLRPLKALLSWSAANARDLPQEHKEQVTVLIKKLPGGGALCQGVFCPRNLIMVGDEMVVIDWAALRRPLVSCSIS